MIEKKLRMLEKNEDITKKEFIAELKEIGFYIGENEDTERGWSDDGLLDTCIYIPVLTGYPKMISYRVIPLDCYSEAEAKRLDIPKETIISDIFNIVTYEYKHLYKKNEVTKKICKKLNITWDYFLEKDAKLDYMLEKIKENPLCCSISDNFLIQLENAGIHLKKEIFKYENTYNYIYSPVDYMLQEGEDEFMQDFYLCTEDIKTGLRSSLSYAMNELERYFKGRVYQ